MKPWKTNSSRVIYENPWIRVVENQVTNPNGGEGIYGVVHFRKLAVGVIPVDEEDHTWLVGQYRYPRDRYEWEIPEGGGDPDLPPLESAQRELREETGIVARDYELLLGEFQTSNAVCDEIAFVYLARGLSFHEPNPDDTEDLTVRRLPLSEAFAMVHRGEISDSLSVVGLLKLELRMLRGGE